MRVRARAHCCPKNRRFVSWRQQKPVFWEDNPVSIFRGGESSPSKPLARGKLSPTTSCPFTFLDSYRQVCAFVLDKSSANAALSLLKLRRSDRLNRKTDVSSCRNERRIA